MSGNESSVHVSGGHLVVFADDVTNEMREDVLSSSLYFQLAASKKYSRFNEFDSWRGICVELMTLSGWIITHEKSFELSDEQFILDINRMLAARLAGRVPLALLARLETFCAEPSGSSSAARALLLGHALHLQLPLTHAPPALGVNAADVRDTALSLLISFVSAEGLISTVFILSTTPLRADADALSAHLGFGRMAGNCSVTVMHVEFIEKKFGRVRQRLVAELAGRRNSEVLAHVEGRDDE